MKSSVIVFSLGSLLVLNSCQSLNRPLDAGGDYDPLNLAGSATSSAADDAMVDASAARYTPGQWVESSMANTQFFKAIPKGNASADKALPAGTPLKVVATQGSYVKVQLESGEIGFVPEIMVVEQSAPADVPLVPVPDPSVMGDESGLAPEPEIPGLEGDGASGAPSFSVPEPEMNETPAAPAGDSAPAPVPDATTPAPEPEIPSLEETGDTPPPPPSVPGVTE
ncbi:MAG: hypothetical protein ACQKBY_08190 [Verrucomicrobiales bacterium]